MKVIETETAADAAKTSLEMVAKKLGRIPNMYSVMANSPATLEAYIKFNTALSGGTLGNKMAEMIALATAESNACSYCLSAHTFFGKKVGLSDEEIDEARDFFSNDEKIQASLAFVKKLLETPQEISKTDITPLQKVGYSNGDILEIIANVIRNMFTNYINIVAETQVDWPAIVTPKKSQKDESRN
jgi:uncharacterized peroxidase-related enzyme